MTTTLFNRGANWTTEEATKLKELFDNGSNLEAICRAMGRTPSAVVSRLEMYGRLVQLGQVGHYYPRPEDAWCLWQEIRDINAKLSSEP